MRIRPILFNDMDVYMCKGFATACTVYCGVLLKDNSISCQTQLLFHKRFRTIPIVWHRQKTFGPLFGTHRPQFERFLKDFFDEHERHLAENVHAFRVIFCSLHLMDFCAK